MRMNMNSNITRYLVTLKEPEMGLFFTNFFSVIFPFVIFGFIMFTIFTVFVYLRHIPHFGIMNLFKYFYFKEFDESCKNKSKFFKFKLLLIVAVTRYSFISVLLRFGISLGIYSVPIFTPFSIFIWMVAIIFVDIGVTTVIFWSIFKFLVKNFWLMLLEFFEFSKGANVFYGMFGLMHESVRIRRTPLSGAQEGPRVVQKEDSVFSPNLGRRNLPGSSLRYSIPSLRRDFAFIKFPEVNGKILLKEFPKDAERHAITNEISLPPAKDTSFGGPKDVIKLGQLTSEIKWGLLNNIARGLLVGCNQERYLEIFETDVGFRNHFEFKISKIFNLEFVPYKFGVKGKGFTLVSEIIEELNRLNSQRICDPVYKVEPLENVVEKIIKQHFPNASGNQLPQLLVELNSITIDLTALVISPYHSLNQRSTNDSFAAPFSQNFSKTIMDSRRDNLYEGDKSTGDHIPSAIFDFLFPGEDGGHMAFESKIWYEMQLGVSKIIFGSTKQAENFLGMVTSGALNNAYTRIVVGGHLTEVKSQFPFSVRVPFSFEKETGSLSWSDRKKLNQFCMDLALACKEEGITSTGMVHSFVDIDWGVPIDNEYFQQWLTEFSATATEQNGIISIKFDPAKIAQKQIEKLEQYKPIKKVELDRKEASINQWKGNIEFFTAFNKAQEKIGVNIKTEYQIIINKDTNFKRTKLKNINKGPSLNDLD